MCRVTKIAIEPVWYLPGVAGRFGVNVTDLRRDLFEHTGGMFPELVTRPDLNVFLPPIGGTSVYIMGDPALLGRPEIRIACRVHDECNGSDVFGSDICTCRPYLAHGVEVCVATAQQGGLGVVVYNRKEGRALGEVTKFLVYNARKRQVGGDRAEAYFQRTECVAGVSDMRVQELMPDVLHWLGITRIDQLISMSNMKYAPIVASGIEVIERVPIPDELIPPDADVEIDAKKAAGYYTDAHPGCCRVEAGQRPRVAGLSAMPEAQAAAWLMTPDAVREQCNAMLALAERDALPHFTLDLSRLDDAADYVAGSDAGRIIRTLPSRITRAGGTSRPAGSTDGRALQERLHGCDATELARTAHRSLHRQCAARCGRRSCLDVPRTRNRPDARAIGGAGDRQPARVRVWPVFR